MKGKMEGELIEGYHNLYSHCVIERSNRSTTTTFEQFKPLVNRPKLALTDMSNLLTVKTVGFLCSLPIEYQ